MKRALHYDLDLDFRESVRARELSNAIQASPIYATYRDDATSFIARRYELVKTVCRNIMRLTGMPRALTEGQVKRWGDPFYAARTLEKMAPGFAEVFENVLTLYAPEYPVSNLRQDKEDKIRLIRASDYEE